MLRSIDPPKANPESLLGIMRDAYEGKVVIPEFQRSFVWAREDIEELLVSVLQGYFVGTFLMLDTPTDRPMFPFRPVEGLQEVNGSARPHNHPTVRLVLDGQQRITSLFYVLYEPRIPLRNAKNPYRFFFRLDLALDADPSDAISGISQSDRRRIAEMERLIAEDRAIPFSLLRDSSAFYKWFYKEQRFLQTEEEKVLVEGFYHRFQNFMVPVVALSAEAGKDNIVNIFERINRTGVTLSLFDLAVARLYLKQVGLRGLWEDFERSSPEAAKTVKPEFLLKVIAISRGREPRKSTLLDVIDELSKEEFEAEWAAAAECVAEAYARTTAAKGGYGAFSPAWIPYSTVLVPLAVMLRKVSALRGGAEMFQKVDRWYWASVFTQRYDSAVDTRSYSDVREMEDWLKGGSAPGWLAAVSPDGIDLSVDESRSALYRGLMCLVVLEGARDFMTGQVANLNDCHDDHIFPKSKFGKAHDVDLILNRTLISGASNVMKGNHTPSGFLPKMLEKHGGDWRQVTATLASHLIPPAGVDALRRDDFDAFVEARRDALKARIQEKLR
ncbi:MAG: DUF262 domain-containing protein [Armatimonadota bacterium]|nr:DUF262 domain-containing protein [Armatimonadota bacterium]